MVPCAKCQHRLTQPVTVMERTSATVLQMCTGCAAVAIDAGTARRLTVIADGTVPVWIDYRDGNYSMTRADGSEIAVAPGLANAVVPAWLLAQYEQHCAEGRWWHAVVCTIDKLTWP